MSRYPRTCFSRPFPSRRSARWTGIVAGLALTATILSVPVEATAEPPAAANTPVLERADEAAAQVTARMTGQRVLISDKTTETSQYYALPSGEIEATIVAGPVRMRAQHGGWVDVDLTLVQQPDGSVAPKAHPQGLKLAGKGGRDLVSLDGKRSAAWPDPLPAPELNGTVATYREVKPGIDLVVEVTRTGYQQRLLLKTREATAQASQLQAATAQSSGANFDAFVQNTFTTDQSGATELKLGTYDGGTNKARSYLRFDNQEWLWDKQVQAATLNLWEHHSFSCTASGWEAWRTPDVTSTVRWSNQPTWLERVGTSTQTKGFSTACGDGWVTIPVTAAFQYTAANRLAKTSIGLKASETDNNGWKRFASREAAANPPSVTITYQTKTAVTAQATVPETVCATGTSRPYIGSLTPQLRAQISDGAGAQVSATFEWKPVDGTAVTTATAGPGVAGSWLGTSIGALTEGSSYAWRVQGTAGTTPGAWSPWCEFTVDTQAPSTAPTVSSTTYPASQWSGGAGTAGTFTFGAAGVADVVAYEYGVDANPPDQVVNAATQGATTSVVITPTADGPHTLWVRTRDRAGNRSPLTAYGFAVGGGAVTAPKTGDVSAAKTAITGVGRPDATGVTYQWRRGDTDAWGNIPAAHVQLAAGGGAVSWPLPTSGGGQFPKLNWNLEATLAATDSQSIPRDGPVQIRGTFAGGVAASSGGVKLTFDRNLATAATSEIGPGEVNLLTGNLTLSDSDVSVDAYGSDLTVTRTYNTRRASQTDQAGMFGPGWISGALVEEAETPYTSLGVFGSLVQVGLPDGDTVGFTARNGADFDPEVGQEFLRLTYTSATDSYRLADQDGTSVTFTRVTGSAAGKYFPTAVTQPGSNQTTTYLWERVTVAGVEVVRPTRMLAPVPDGVSCTALSRGCRALNFTYATTTTATASALGDYAGRVKEISFTAWDPDLTTPAMRTVPMASYSYDTTGRLRASWDPRIPTMAKETYEYQADGVLSVIKPPGEEPWQLSYTTVSGDSAPGRLHKVTRSALSAGTATTTVGYKVPLSGTGAPNDLSPGQTKRWGQLEAPTDATAIFPADQASGGWERTTVSYLDANGRLANTATPGGNLTANWYDGFGNVVRSLTAENRARALNQSQSDGDATERAIAQAGSTLSTYSLDGLRLESTSGPETEVQLGNGTITRGRQVVRNTYDQGAPTSGGPYNLVTTEETQVRHWGANGTEVEADRRVTSTGYNWALREPTLTTTDPGGLSQTTRTVFDPVTGLPTSTTQAAGGTTTNTPATRKTIYYRATAGSGFAECDLRPEWANLACRVQPGGQAASGPELAATVTTYDMLHQPRVKVEKTSAGTLRTTTISYDAGGRVLDKQITAGVSMAEHNVYDPVTGLLLKSQSAQAEIVRTYDTLGRVTSYKDADGNLSTTEYDLLGRQSKTTDGKGTRTYTYDHRGFLTSVADSMTGAYTGDYNADGKLVTETWPNGIKVETSYDAAGQEAGITYSKTCPATDCVLFREALTRTAHGQTAKRVSTLSSQTYKQDQAGRVTTVEDTVGERCTTRTYGFNTASDRTTSTRYGPAADGSCQTATPAAARSWSYDTADRVSTAGYVYDALGRTTTVPTIDTGAPAAGNVTATYHANDLVDTISQGGRTTDYTIDVTGERVRSWTDATVQRINHYDGDDDKPVWTQEGPERFTRVVAGLAGMSAIVDSDSGVPEWQISDLSGDIVATVHDGDDGLSTTSETDEYGQVRDPEAVGKQRYGWFGAEQRAADAPSGIVLMGVRLYNPATGRFLQTDPVYGGSCNAYDYACADPVDKTDLDGKKVKKKSKKWQPVHWPGHVWRFAKWAGGKIRKIWNGYWSGVWRFHKWGFKQYRNLGRWTWRQGKRGWRKLFG